MLLLAAPLHVWLLFAQLSAAPSGSLASAPAADTGSYAAAQPSQPPAAFDATRFDSLTANTLRGLLEDAVEMGLPTRPLINRALEGSARRMSGERIIRVVREFAAALHDARQALGASSSEAELDAGATALRAGLDPQALIAMRSTRPAGTAVTALVVLTDLVQRGVPGPQAREAVTSLARMPRSDDALLSLQLTVAKNASRGPGMAVDALNRYVRGALSGPLSPPTPAAADRKPVRPPDP